MLQWLFWQMAGLGPMAGQNHHFGLYATEQIPYAIERYVKETNRLYGVLNKRLADREFIAGEYSIADMASTPGSFRGSVSNKIWMTSRISGAGSRLSGTPGCRSCVPPGRRISIPRLP